MGTEGENCRGTFTRWSCIQGTCTLADLFSVAHCGCLQYDVSLPLSVYYDLVEIIRERVKDVARCTVGYGHVGDGEHTYCLLL